METVRLWELEIVRWIRGGASPALDGFAQFVNLLGSGAAYIALAAFLFWCVDEKKSVRLAVPLLVSAWVNLVLKSLLDLPRPFYFDETMAEAAAGGFPAWHAQNALVAWFTVASWGKTKRGFVPAAIFCVLVSLSGVYLGAYFPSDVLGGWLVGGALLFLRFLLGKRIEALLAEHAPRAGLISAAAVSFLMIAYRPVNGVIVAAGLLLGLGVGFHLCKRYVDFTAYTPLSRLGFGRYLALFVRVVIGAGAAVALFVLSGNLIYRFQGSDNYPLFEFARFAVIALWITVGAPFVFRITHLSQSNVIHYQEHK